MNEKWAIPEDIKCGELVWLDIHTHQIRPSDPREDVRRAMGIAARNIAKGEAITISFSDKSDIILQGSTSKLGGLHEYSEKEQEFNPVVGIALSENTMELRL